MLLKIICVSPPASDLFARSVAIALTYKLAHLFVYLLACAFCGLSSGAEGISLGARMRIVNFANIFLFYITRTTATVAPVA